jgi:hypothetical protein
MSIQSLRRTASCRFLIALLALGSWPGIAAAQDEAADAAPLNAHMKRYGGGWECDRGYRDFRRSCVRGEESIASLCRREDIAANLYYR